MSGFFNIIGSVVKNRGMKRLSAVNRMLDYLSLQCADNKYKILHKNLQDILNESHEKWTSYDYGEGYFYQSYSPLIISGLRNTEFRFKLYKFDRIINQNDRVLDIGCNSGFLSLKIASRCKHVDAFDNNPYLIRIAELCRIFEGRENVRFQNCTFDNFLRTMPYSIILSLANHHTFDGNMRPEFSSYLRALRNMTVAGGKLIFESHPGEYKERSLKEQFVSNKDLFRIDEEMISSVKTNVLDTDRLVVWLTAV